MAAGDRKPGAIRADIGWSRQSAFRVASPPSRLGEILPEIRAARPPWIPPHAPFQDRLPAAVRPTRRAPLRIKMEPALASWAFDKPHITLGLRRMNSTINRAIPLRTRYSPTIAPVLCRLPPLHQRYQPINKPIPSSYRRCGVHPNTGRRRLNSIWKAHAPWQLRFNPIAAIARKEATDAPDCVPDRRCWSCQVECPQPANPRPPSLKHERRNSEEQAAKPGKSRGIPKHTPAHFPELAGCVDHVPQLGADDPCQHRNCHHPHSIGIDLGTFETPVHHERGRDCREPQHKAKGWNLGIPKIKVDVEIGNHALSV